MTREQFVKSLREYRQRQGITIKELARRIQRGAETVGKWLRNAQAPSAANIRLVSATLDLSVSQPAPTPAPTPAKPLANRVLIVRDRSGSMGDLRDAAQQAYNRTLAELRKQSIEKGQQTRVTVLDFGSRHSFRHTDMDVNLVPDDTGFYATDMGSTALLETTHIGLEKLFRQGDVPGADTAFLAIVQTDGEENVSPYSYREELPKLIKKLQATDRWTIAFQVPPGGRALLVEFGIHPGNIQEWEQTDRGMQETAVANTIGFDAYYQGRTVGQNSTRSFYTTDASKITQADLGKMTDISAACRVWEVKSEQKIRPFVEGKLKGPMLKGAAFYQLMKTEKEVQDYKRILLMEKGKTAIYEGVQVRQLLGLPTVGTVKVAPGNHANFDIFIESTSTNRKLPRGTRVIYAPQFGVPFTEGPSARARR